MYLLELYRRYNEQVCVAEYPLRYVSVSKELLEKIPVVILKDLLRPWKNLEVISERCWAVEYL